MVDAIKFNKDIHKLSKNEKNNVIISNEANVNRSSLVNYILNNPKIDYCDCRNLEINDSLLKI